MSSALRATDHGVRANMKSTYFTCNAEEFDGREGSFVFEVIENEIVRQIFIFGEDMYWATLYEQNHEQHIFTDQPEFPEEDIPRLIEEHNLKEIIETYFMNLWNQAQSIKYD